MANGDTRSRKAHVKRIFQLTDDDGNVVHGEGASGTTNTDIWVDVLRIDNINYNFQSTTEGIQGQTSIYCQIWNDDQNNKNPTGGVDDSGADPQYENANASRKMKQIEIKDNDAPDDQTKSVFFWITEQVEMKLNGVSGRNVQDLWFIYDNTSEQDGNQSRKAITIKVPYNDLNGLEMDDGNGVSLILDWKVYKQGLEDGKQNQPPAGSDSTAKFLTVEIADKFALNSQSDPDTGIKGQALAFVLDNTELDPDKGSDLFGAGDSGASNSDGTSAVIRTDPMQVIVNVSDGVAVIFGPKDQDAPDQNQQQSQNSRRRRMEALV